MKKILVIDDDDAILDVTRIILEDEGHQVKTSDNGEALSRLGDVVPDLIILDVLLSGEDGKELCRQLKADKATRHIPVMLFSAHSKAFLEEGIGHNYFLQKPFDIQEFLRAVHSLTEWSTVETHITSPRKPYLEELIRYDLVLPQR